MVTETIDKSAKCHYLVPTQKIIGEISHENII